MGISRESSLWLAKHKLEKPEDVMKGKVDWSSALQPFLSDPSVVVSMYHPVHGLQMLALFVYLVLEGHATPNGKQSETQILSGVRKKGSFGNRTPGSQWWFWARDLSRLGKKPSRPPLRQPRGSGGVANPEVRRGEDCEGIDRFSSNHVAQLMPEPWNVMVGYATDLFTRRGTNAEAWRPVHEALRTFGLDWPLKTGFVERWHMQSQGLDMCWYGGEIAWPERPGVHRPLIPGFRGGDVGVLQEQIASAMGLHTVPGNFSGPTPEGAIRIDDDFGPTSSGLAAKVQKALGSDGDGVWVEDDQVRFEAARAKAKNPAPVVITEPTPEPTPEPEPGSDPVDTALASGMLATAEKRVVEAEALAKKSVATAGEARALVDAARAEIRQ